jgi:hypothetical protein
MNNIFHVIRSQQQKPIPLKTPIMYNYRSGFKGNGRFTENGTYKGLKPTCGHAICHDYYCRGMALGITILVVQDNHFIFGIEADGTKDRKNKMSMCMGHRNDGETCWLQTAVRELYEEFHISMSIQEFQLRMIIEFIHQRTVGTFVIDASGIDFQKINNSVINSSKNPIKNCFNEMTQLIRIPFFELLQSNNNSIQIFTYLIANHYSKFIFNGKL